MLAKLEMFTPDAATAAPRHYHAPGINAFAPPIGFGDETFVAVARDAQAGIWRLEVEHRGQATLSLNQIPVAVLPAAVGAVLLQDSSCPYERAADIVAMVVARGFTRLGERARSDLEFELARWIPLYFDL